MSYLFCAISDAPGSIKPIHAHAPSRVLPSNRKLGLTVHSKTTILIKYLDQYNSYVRKKKEKNINVCDSRLLQLIERKQRKCY